MDAQSLINIVGGIFLSVLGWLWKKEPPQGLTVGSIVEFAY